MILQRMGCCIFAGTNALRQQYLSRMRIILACLLALSAASCVRPVVITAPSQPLRSVDDEVRSLVEMVNGHRRRVGCEPLAWIDAVARVAEKHSEDMVRRDYFGHNNPDGRSPFDRLENAGIRFKTAAENIAAGQRTGQEVFNSWLDSAGHRRNIENCALKQHGIGLVRGTPSMTRVFNAWTHVFVTLP